MVTIIAGQTLVVWTGVPAGLSFLATAGLGLYSKFVNPKYFVLHKKSTALTIPLALLHMALAIAFSLFGWLP